MRALCDMCSAKRHSVCFSRMVEGMRGHRQHGWVYGCGWGCDDGTGPLIGVDAGTPGRCCPLREIVAHTGLALLAVAPASWVRASEHQCDCPPPTLAPPLPSLTTSQPHHPPTTYTAATTPPGSGFLALHPAALPLLVYSPTCVLYSALSRLHFPSLWRPLGPSSQTPCTAPNTSPL